MLTLSHKVGDRDLSNVAVQKLVVPTIVNVKSRISIVIHVATKVAKLVSTMNKFRIYFICINYLYKLFVHSSKCELSLRLGCNNISIKTGILYNTIVHSFVQ